VGSAPLPLRSRPIAFVKEGEAKSKSKGKAAKWIPRDSSDVNVFGLLSSARDWTVDADLPELHADRKSYSFPYDVCVTSLRIDMFILSRAARICVAGPELTVPFEENLLKRHTDKFEKYQTDFAQSGVSPNWRLELMVLEVGSRGYVAPSFAKCLKRLGFSPTELRALRDAVSMMARRCSYIIWQHRFNKDWMPLRLHSSSL
jgi:hypothetical protein